jgi:hypothetical protein
MKKIFVNPRIQALQDITKEILSKYKKCELYGPQDRWIVIASDLNTKDNIKLNAQLGLRSVNMNALNMNRKKTK